MTGCCDVIDALAYFGPRDPNDIDLAVSAFVGLSLFERGRFTRKFELWAFREILHVIPQVVRAWKGLPGDAHLAASRCNRRDNRGATQ